MAFTSVLKLTKLLLNLMFTKIKKGFINFFVFFQQQYPEKTPLDGIPISSKPPLPLHTQLVRKTSTVSLFYLLYETFYN